MRVHAHTHVHMLFLFVTEESRDAGWRQLAGRQALCGPFHPLWGHPGQRPAPRRLSPQGPSALVGAWSISRCFHCSLLGFPRPEWEPGAAPELVDASSSPVMSCAEALFPERRHSLIRTRVLFSKQEDRIYTFSGRGGCSRLPRPGIVLA